MNTSTEPGDARSAPHGAIVCGAVERPHLCGPHQRDDRTEHHHHGERQQHQQPLALQRQEAERDAEAHLAEVRRTRGTSRRGPRCTTTSRCRRAAGCRWHRRARAGRSTSASTTACGRPTRHRASRGVGSSTVITPPSGSTSSGQQHHGTSDGGGPHRQRPRRRRRARRTAPGRDRGAAVTLGFWARPSRVLPTRRATQRGGSERRCRVQLVPWARRRTSPTTFVRTARSARRAASTVVHHHRDADRRLPSPSSLVPSVVAATSPCRSPRR